MSFFIGLLMAVLVLDCLLLILLVLIQLPKKDAGSGLAFGGAATDALFGAGSGNALTKITKYSAGIFFALALIISLLQAQKNRAERTLVIPTTTTRSHAATSEPEATAPATAPAGTPASAPITAPSPSSTNASLSIPAPAAAGTNAPATP